jgi:16S rRNA (guanine527-N7)-methyltransferase
VTVTDVTPVSRETAVASLFGDRVDRLHRYAELLATVGIERGLVGPRERDRIWDRHVLNSAALTPLLPPTGSVLDVGSGAGLPGVPLALARPDLTVVLLEPLLRRATFLQEVVAELDLANVRVRRARAEDVAGDERAEAVVSRAVAPLPKLLSWCLPLTTPGGTVLAMKGDRGADELSAVEPALPGLGVTTWGLEVVGSGLGLDPVRVIRVVRGR